MILQQNPAVQHSYRHPMEQTLSLARFQQSTYIRADQVVQRFANMAWPVPASSLHSKHDDSDHDSSTTVPGTPTEEMETRSSAQGDAAAAQSAINVLASLATVMGPTSKKECADHDRTESRPRPSWTQLVPRLDDDRPAHPLFTTRQLPMPASLQMTNAFSSQSGHSVRRDPAIPVLPSIGSIQGRLGSWQQGLMPHH